MPKAIGRRAFLAQSSGILVGTTFLSGFTAPSALASPKFAAGANTAQSGARKQIVSLYMGMPELNDIGNAQPYLGKPRGKKKNMGHKGHRDHRDHRDPGNWGLC